MRQITLAMLGARAADEIVQGDRAADVIDGGAAETADMLRDYLLGQGLVINTIGGHTLKGNEVFENACEILRANYRAKYCNRVRRGVNMIVAREALDATPETRAAWTDDSEHKKVWLKIQHFGRTKLQRVCNIIWPPAKPDDDDAKKGAKGGAKDKPATADDVLAALKSFLSSNPAPVLVATLFDQIAAHRPK